MSKRFSKEALLEYLTNRMKTLENDEGIIWSEGTSQLDGAPVEKAVAFGEYQFCEDLITKFNL